MALQRPQDTGVLQGPYIQLGLGTSTKTVSVNQDIFPLSVPIVPGVDH